MANRPYNRSMVKDDARGARTGRNVHRSITLSEQADSLVEGAVALRNKGSVKKTNRSEVLEALILAHADELKKKP
jgi:hypothetical protein